MRFLGNIEAKIDAKGRAFLPASFRKVLQAEKEERLVLRKDWCSIRRRCGTSRWMLCGNGLTDGTNSISKCSVSS